MTSPINGKYDHTVVIYGGGIIFRTILPDVKKDYPHAKIVVVDGNPQLWDSTIEGIPVYNPKLISELRNYTVVIATVQGYLSVKDKLLHHFNVDQSRIDDRFAKKMYAETFMVRNEFLRYYASTVYDRELAGACAEGGVFEGDFAKEINKCFPDKKLFLFDTFQGFDERDTNKEDGYIAQRKGEFRISGVSPTTVLDKMNEPENVIIKPGFFPDTAIGIEDEFVFVNLDFDLYAPTLAGLQFFWPRMVRGGILLVHDYFSTLLFDKYAFSKVKQAVDEFSVENNVPFIPIGDKLSVAFFKV